MRPPPIEAYGSIYHPDLWLCPVGVASNDLTILAL